MDRAVTEFVHPPWTGNAPDRSDALDRARDRKRDIHERLALFNRRRLTPGHPSAGWREEHTRDLALLAVESEFIESARRKLQPLVSDVPRDPASFVEWFEALAESGPGQGDALFPWLAESASREHMRWFLTQEISGEAGFDDLLALTQLKLPPQAKLEMARNYWDEMGQGNAAAMHSALLERVADHFRLTPLLEETVLEALVLGNIMVGLAVNRRYAYQSIGALGVIELTAPTRTKYVDQGLRRLGVPAKDRNYFALHSILDVKHAKAWNREVIASIVGQDGRTAPWIAEGALLRLECGAACFARYRRAFGL